MKDKCGLKGLRERGKSADASRFVSPGCNVTYVEVWGATVRGGVTDSTVILCYTAPGVGHDMAWSFTVGDQLSSSDIAEGDDDTMRYHVPVVTSAAVSSSDGERLSIPGLYLTCCQITFCNSKLCQRKQNRQTRDGRRTSTLCREARMHPKEKRKKE